MTDSQSMRVGYVLKRYPRYSETFIVNEILAHEAAGIEIEIFSLMAPNDTHFQDALACVRAPVTYLRTDDVGALELWSAFREAGAVFPRFWEALGAFRDEEVFNLYRAILLAHASRAKGIQHLHAHFGTAATSVARMAARFTGLRYTFTAHARDIFHTKTQPDDLRRKLSDAAAVVTVSEYNRRYLRETYGSAAARVERVHNGLNLASFPYATPRDRTQIIVAIGRLVEKKGFADLIDACAILARAGHRFQCEIIGTGELAGDLRGQTERLGLHEVVTFIGALPHRDVIDHVRRAAVLVAPSVIGCDGNREGLPTVLPEAMALGTPCVATTLTGIPEAIKDGKTGLLVSPHDPPSLAAAIERLLVNPKLRVELAASARRLVDAEFDLHRNTRHLREIFADAIPEAR